MEEKHPLHVGIVPELSYVPKAGIVGSYGGGDAMKVALQMVCRPAPLAIIPKQLKDKISKDIEQVIQEQNDVPKDKRVAKLPERLPDLKHLKWSATFEISGHVYDEPTFNLMYQGLLYSSVVKDPQRLGASKYPLIGQYDASGTLPSDAADPASIGQDRLKWADQHIHKVDFHGDQWHFGSDMAKFRIDKSKPVVSSWCVMVDLEGLTCNVMYLLIVAPQLEGAVEKALRQCRDGLDTKALKAKFDDVLGALLDADSKRSLHTVLDSYSDP